MSDVCICIIRDVWGSDEALGYLHGDVNSQNLRIWGGFHPETVDKAPLHSPKLTIGMYLALSAQGIIGSFLFEGTEKTIRVNKKR